MAIKLRKTDIVTIGLGGAAGVAVLPLAEAGAKIIALEAGNWLTPADVDFFRPWFAPYLAHNAYPGDWTLPACPRIPPEHGSEYVRRLVNERRGVTPAS